MHRLKAAFGQRLRSRLEHNQTHETLLRDHLLNRGPTPATVSVAWPLLSGMGFFLYNRAIQSIDHSKIPRFFHGLRTAGYRKTRQAAKICTKPRLWE